MEHEKTNQSPILSPQAHPTHPQYSNYDKNAQGDHQNQDLVIKCRDLENTIKTYRWICVIHFVYHGLMMVLYGYFILWILYTWMFTNESRCFGHGFCLEGIQGACLVIVFLLILVSIFWIHLYGFRTFYYKHGENMNFMFGAYICPIWLLIFVAVFYFFIPLLSLSLIGLAGVLSFLAYTASKLSRLYHELLWTKAQLGEGTQRISIKF